MSNKNSFTSRWGLAMTLIGASVGPGSVWRFPRMAALYEGGAFIIAMIVSFLIIGVWDWLTAEREVLIKNVSWRFTHTCLRVTHVWSSLKESAVHQTTECIRISSFVNSIVVISDLTTCNCLQHETFLSQHVALVVIKISVVSGRSIDALIYKPQFQWSWDVV